MAKGTAAGYAKRIGFKTAMKYLDRNPEENIPKLLKWMVRADSLLPKKKGVDKKPFEKTQNALSNKDGNWFRLATSLWTDIDPGVRKRLFENVAVNATMIGYRKQLKWQKKYGCNVPWAILMDPTSACNLKCIGCWAAEYGHGMNLSLKTLDSIIRQGKEMGTYAYLYSGGEPLVRKADIIKLCEMHPDCAFLAFTNGTLIDEAFCNEMLRVQNFIPALSIEGYEEHTDARRGKGTHQKVEKAMALLKEHKLPFAASCCYTSQNTGIIGSETYFDYLIEMGCKMAWFFTYIPVGVNAVPELMASAEQREFMYHQLRKFRKTKSIFTIDFWNDGEYAGGCIAGGRSYMHINAAGDIEPCAFIHYSDTNIHQKTLLEAYQAPLFMAYRNNQPFNENHLRPCPLLDNPGALSRMVQAADAKSTDLMSPENVEDLCSKCKDAALAWSPVADELWRCSCQNSELFSTQQEREPANESG